MDKDLKYYLLSLDFTQEDINNLINTAPNLKLTPYGHAMDNIMEVVKKGFPIDDIDGLVFANPSFLTISKERLVNRLSNISGNIEEALKADPFLI